MFALILYLSLSFLLILLGLSIKYFKCYVLIAGDNTAPQEKKSKYDTEKLGNLPGKGMIVSAVFMLAAGTCQFKGYT